MAEKEYIKHLYETEGKSLREIAKTMGLSFRTVKKYAYQEDWNAEDLSLGSQRYKVLGEYLETINKWLDNDKKEPRKQRHTIKRVYDRLVAECGYTGSYGSVKKYVNKRKKQEKQVNEGYLPLVSTKGYAQIDFGKFKYYDILGINKQGYALTITFPYSNKGYTQVFQSENQECLLEGMKRIFKHICGVPIELRADNMTTAVAHVKAGKERDLTDGFRRFMLQYRFRAVFCNPASGNEKGNVENKVGYTRRNFFVPVPKIEDFDEFNEKLFERCEQDGERLHYKQEATINSLWEEEKACLLSLPAHEYHVFRYESSVISKQGLIQIDKTSYTVSPEIAGRTVQTKIFYDKIEIYYEHSLLKVLKRSYNQGDEELDWREYLGVLSRKPNAVTQTRFFEQMPKLWQEHLKAAENKERKTSLMLLMEILEDGNEEICDDVIQMANDCGRSDTESLKQCYYLMKKAEFHPKPLVLIANTPVLNYNPDLSIYDGLTAKAVPFGGVSNAN